MRPQSTSIQSFFGRRIATTQTTSSSDTFEPGDGFTPEEIEAVLHPDPREPWTPSQDYDEIEIGELIPGPKRVKFKGRVVNMLIQATGGKRPRAARGCLRIVVKDDTGAIMVRLWYANMEYAICLGHLVSVWTPYISNSDMGALAPPNAPFFTSIFPERDRSCYIMTHENGDTWNEYRTPLGLQPGQTLSGLMTLQNFIQGGYDVTDAKILVCVKSIGVRKRITNKHGRPSEYTVIHLSDDTASATLTLWDLASFSPNTWRPSHTILLITSPGWRMERNQQTRLSINSNTYVEVDPCMRDADWLRSYVKKLTRRSHINPAFPEGVFDVEAVETAQVRVLYTLADVDEFIRANEGKSFMGYLNLLVMEMRLVVLHRQGVMMCAECCGIPVYSKTPSATCKQCSKAVQLSLNPRILGPLIDETATIQGYKLIFSAAAWTELLGHTAEELCAYGADTLRDVENALLYKRVTFGFGWVGDASCEARVEVERSGSVGDGGQGEKDGKVTIPEGRLCIWGVRC